MLFLSWNVNGIRSVLKKDFLGFVKKYNPDVLCVQETKAPKEGMQLDLDGHHQFWNFAEKPGYSGTAVFTKAKPISVKNGIRIKEHDNEGRVITAEYDKFFLVNVYVPNAQRELERLPYRMTWDADFLKYLKKLEKDKPVIFCGDMNVAHQEIDLANPKANEKNHGFTPEERAGFGQFIQAGFIDTFREFVKDKGHYTWWTPMGNCRARNIGWRIDYFCISAVLRPRLKEALILSDVMGSDHCPVGMVLK